MANLKLHYYLIGIFTSIILIFAMSHNAGAVSTVYDLSNYDVVRRLQSDVIDCEIQNGVNTSTGTGGWCSTYLSNTGGGTYLNSILTQSSYSVQSKDLLNFYLIVYSQSGQFQYTPLLFSMSSPLQGWDVLSFEQVNFDDYSKKIEASGNLFISDTGGSYFEFTELEYNSFYRIYDVTLSARSDRTAKFGLVQTTSTPILWFNSSDTGNRVRFSIQNFVQYRRTESQENKEVEEKTQDAVDGSETAGSSSSSSAQSGSASLLSVIGAFAGIITSAQPTNCKINGNMGNLNIGQIDLCANPVPSFVQIIGSIILVSLVIPFVVIMFNRFISIFRSFQS